MANNSNILDENQNLDEQNKGGMNNYAKRSSPSFSIGGNQYKNNQQPVISGQVVKNQIKRTVLKEGIKKGAQAYGVPEMATEKILESEAGSEILDAASSASNPTEGVKAIVGIVAKRTLMQILPAIIVPVFLLIIIVAVIFGRNVSAGMGYGNNDYDELIQEIASVTSNYRSKVKIDGNLILATLIAYNSDVDLISDGSSNNDIEYMKGQVNKLAAYQIITNKSCMYDSSTIRNIANNDDWFDETNYNCILGMEGETYTLSTKEGSYDDDNSGSSFYWNLIDEDFIFNYYNKYMINTKENTEQNEEKINEIIREIYLYYEIMDNIEYGTRSLCSNGITLDGVTMNFEDYIKGVVYSSVNSNDMPIEAIKALAISTRSRALSASNNCTREIHSSTSNLNYQDGYQSNSKVVQAVTETSGQYLTLNGDIFESTYSNFPDLSSECNVVCDNNYCSADLYYDNNKKIGTHTVTVPRIINGIDIVNDGVGSCVGMSIEALEYDALNGANYEEILSKYYSQSVEITISGGEGLINDGTGYLRRIERAQRDNLYYYSESTDYGSGYIAGGLEGECAWYAVKRTNEIIATMGLQDTYNYVYGGGNGRDFCYASDYEQFEKSTNPNDPTLKAGAIISWYDDTYGHVAVVEAVYRDSNGNITSIDVSEAGIGFGQYGRNARTIINNSYNSTLKRKENCEGNNTGCQHFKNISIDNIKNLYGKQQFICYLKIVK